MAFWSMDRNPLGTLANAYVLALLSRGGEVLFYVALFSGFSVAQVGLYSWGIAVAAFFAIALDLGLNQILIRDFSRRTMGFAFALRGSLLVRVPVLSVAAVVLTVWERAWGPASDAFRVVVLASLIQVFAAAEGFCFAWLRSHNRQTLANALSALDPSVRLVAFGVVCLLLHLHSAVGLLAGVAVFHVPILLACAWVVRHVPAGEAVAPGVRLSLGAVRDRLLLPGVIFGLIGLITVTQNRLDWLLVAHYAGRNELANYSLANKAYEVMMLMSGIAMTTIYPWLCRKATPVFMRRVNIMTSGLFSAGGAIALAAALYLPEVMEWVWRDKYQAAYALLRLLLPVSVASMAVMILYYRLIAKGMEGALLKASGVVTALQLAVNIAAVPSYGARGAVLGMAVLAAANLVCYFAIAYRVRLMTGRAVARHVGFMLGMFVTGIVLAQVGLPAPISLALLFGLAAAGWFNVLLRGRERQWVQVCAGRLWGRSAAGLLRERSLV